MAEKIMTNFYQLQAWPANRRLKHIFGDIFAFIMHDYVTGCLHYL